MNVRDHIREQRNEIVPTIHLSHLSGESCQTEASRRANGARGIKAFSRASVPRPTTESTKVKVCIRISLEANNDLKRL